jgi:hypothetical protein
MHFVGPRPCLGWLDYESEVYAHVGRLGAPGIGPDKLQCLCFSLFLAVADPAGYIAFYREFPYPRHGSFVSGMRLGCQ